jgi:hypothetical protein
MNTATIVIAEYSAKTTAVALDTSRCDNELRFVSTLLAEILAQIISGDYDDVIKTMNKLKARQQNGGLNS